MLPNDEIITAREVYKRDLSTIIYSDNCRVVMDTRFFRRDRVYLLKYLQGGY